MAWFYAAEWPTFAPPLTIEARLQNRDKGNINWTVGGAWFKDKISLFSTLDGAQSLSFAKTVLDCDAVAMIRRVSGRFAVDEQNFLRDDIAAHDALVMKEDINIAAIAKKAGCGRDMVFHTVRRQGIKTFDMVNVASGF